MKSILLPILVTAILLLSACSEASTDAELSNYLDQVDTIMEELGDINIELMKMTEDAGPFGVKNEDKLLLDYSEKYDGILHRFEAIEYPNDAIQLRKHTIEIITYHKKMLDEMREYVITHDTYHVDVAESYFTDAEDSRVLAMDEWDRLKELTGEGDGISIWQIFLGLLGLGVVATIAIFVLQLTLGAGITVIAGITATIGAIIRKIKGED